MKQVLLLFSFFIMTFAVNITNGCSLSNETHCEFLPKESKAVHFTVKDINFKKLHITNKMEHFSLKSERYQEVAKHLKEL